MPVLSVSFPCLCVRLQNRTGHLIPAASQKQVLLWIWTPEPFFFAQNIHVQEYPASITKLLTALVVVENASMDEQVTFSHDAVYNVESGSGNKLQLEEGDVLSVKDCLYVMLLQSSNQAANALAEHVGGSREALRI